MLTDYDENDRSIGDTPFFGCPGPGTHRRGGLLGDDPEGLLDARTTEETD